MVGKGVPKTFDRVGKLLINSKFIIMKNSKFIISAGAVVLTIIGFVSTKAERKFASVTTAKFKQLTGSSAITGLAAANFTTVKGTAGKTVFFATVGGTQLASLYTSVSALKKVYYH
jgi:hypothetical protein